MHQNVHTLGMSWEESCRVLGEAAKAALDLQMTAKFARQWQDCRSAFTAGFSEGKYLVVKNPFSADCPVMAGQLLGCSFRKGQRKYLFTSAVLGRDSHAQHECVFQQLEGLAIAWPDNVQQMQRRLYARATVPPDMRVLVKIWPAALALTCQCPNDPPLTSTHLVDISAGGALVKLQKGDIELNLDSALLIEIQLPAPDNSVCVEAFVRRKAEIPSQNQVIYGLQFIGLDHTRHGRQTLQKLGKFALKLQALAHSSAGKQVDNYVR